MASLTQTLREAVRRLGLLGTLGLIARKIVKRQRYRMMFREVRSMTTRASMRESRSLPAISISERERAEIIASADRMLADENRFFSFPYHLKGVERPWEYDPLEKKHWPRRHYTEQKLHGPDTPRDVKIVWEINRFVDLPTLAEAAYLTRDEKYAREVSRRVLSWIEENPFAGTINWASALEIAIRLLSWTASLEILRIAGFDVYSNDAVRRSIYEQARYLSADLSLDKVQPTNHLIGEAAGLLVIATLWDYPTARIDAAAARRILEQQILLQTFADGATREATSWYHQFVTGFFDIADRIAATHGEPMSDAFRERLARMKSYLNAMTYEGSLVRYGDADDGWPILFSGEPAPWLDAVFGPAPTGAAKSDGVFATAKQAALHPDHSFVFIRGGEFGMGGAGFSSHAHDDLLAPILMLDGLEVLTDPGTYVYNGDPESRRKYRGPDAHNSLVIGEHTAARQRMNFGWHAVRPPASVEVIENSRDRAIIRGSYAEWPEHVREIEVSERLATVRDRFERSPERPVRWHFHLHPRWSPLHRSSPELEFYDADRNRLEIHLVGAFDTIKLEHYDYSPGYRVTEQAFALELTASVQPGTYEVRMTISRQTTE